ncbi:SpoIID/LytB domain-containing protein [Leptolyngbya sp. FACHB-541]|uniref:SpoIID/LytB domain-containing protein n=1 Tax=Leptolyngbya sp. FACHB-541 TaxID=2692810 RepID=UPI0016885F1D|nr:SpoIID/LytB domain-containing protein [Leptolyngbya sp. FACHB-541]MBD1997153.1 SpoIID/LytB domain-containing protein [Leptolyngbya sp. FACHB-541]
MNWQQTIKRLKPYTWVMLPLLGVVAVGVVLARQLLLPGAVPAGDDLAYPVERDATKLAAASILSPDATPATQASPTPSPTPSAAAPTLTPEQEELNRRNTEEFLSSLPSVDSLIEMRVAIATGIPSAAIRTSTDAVVFDEDGEQLQTLSAETTYTAQPSGNSVQLNSAQLPSVVMIDPSPQGLFYLGDRGYRGRLLLIAEGGNLWAVNFVDMRSYLYSVVGSEVSPSWNVEALKAQAIAARSYGLTYHFKPVHSAYDIGSTERYQVYRGIEREADTIRQAVDATAGEFVSYEGGIVESLYAASDAIVMEAFQGRGMSQLGALDLANQGYSYQQILSNYYPGTEVGRIKQEFE